MGTTYYAIYKRNHTKVRLGKRSENSGIITFLEGVREVEVVSEHSAIANDHDENGNTTLDRDYHWAEDNHATED